MGEDFAEVDCRSMSEKVQKFLNNPVRLLNLESQGAELKAEVSKLKAESSELKAERSESKAERSELKAKNATLDKKIHHLEKQLNEQGKFILKIVEEMQKKLDTSIAQYQKEELHHVLQAMQAMQARIDSADRRLDEHTALTAIKLGENAPRMQAIEQKLSHFFQNRSSPPRSRSVPKLRSLPQHVDDAPAKEAAEDEAIAKKTAEDEAIAKKAAEDEAIAKKTAEDEAIAKENGKNSEMAEAKDAEQQGLPSDDTNKLEALTRVTGIANELIEKHLKEQSAQIVEDWSGRTRHSKQQFNEKIDQAIADFLNRKSEVLDDLLAKNWESEILMQLLKQRVDESDKLMRETKKKLFEIIDARITKEKAASGGEH